MFEIDSPSDQIELAALCAIHEAAPEALKQTLGLKLENIQGVMCSASVSDPSILINRCFVVDHRSLTDRDAITAVKRFYTDLGIDRFFLHVTHGTGGVPEALSSAGMQKARGWMKFRREATPARVRNPGTVVREIGPEHAEAFAEIVVPSFDMNESSMALIASIINHPDWHLYMGFEDEKPAATGAVFRQDGAGYFDWGSTHPDFRQRGFQGALLAHRINDSIRQGIDELYTATGEAAPGDPQHSYKNIMRYGFREHYLRENWTP